MKWWRIRKVANAATWELMFFGVGLLTGLMVFSFLHGLPWPKGLNSEQAIQQSMALAGWTQAAISIASTIVGAFGLYLLWGTLRATDRAADTALAAQADLRKQVKALPRIQNAKIGRTASLEFSFEIRNAGQTAIEHMVIRFSVTLSSPPWGEDQVMISSEADEASMVGPGETYQHRHFLEPEAAQVITNTLARASCEVRLQISATYRDIFGEERDFSGEFFSYFGVGQTIPYGSGGLLNARDLRYD